MEERRGAARRGRSPEEGNDERGNDETDGICTGDRGPAAGHLRVPVAYPAGPGSPRGDLDTSFGPGSGASGIVNAWPCRATARSSSGAISPSTKAPSVAISPGSTATAARTPASWPPAPARTAACTPSPCWAAATSSSAACSPATTAPAETSSPAWTATVPGQRLRPPAGTNNLVRCMALPSGGDVLIGGTFTQYGVVGRDRWPAWTAAAPGQHLPELRQRGER